MKTNLRSAIGCLLGLAAAASALGFTFITDDRTGGAALPIKWPATNTGPGTVAIQIKLGSNANGTINYNAAVQSALADWNAVIGNLQITATTAAPGAAAQSNGINEVAFADKAFDQNFDSQTLAVTTTWSIGNERTQADILFNNAYQPWGVYDGPRQSNVDLRRVALHELGHLLGLDHPDTATPPQSVSAIMNSRISGTDRLTSDDITGAQQIYGPPDPPVNDSFANATAITLTPNSATVTGYNTKGTKETGEPVHTGSTDDPAFIYRGGRSVWWKWTAPTSGSMTVDTRGSLFDTTLGVYSQVASIAINGLTEVGFNDDVGGNPHVQASTVTFTATSGVTYYFLVDGFNDNDGNGADSAAVKLNLVFTPSSSPPPTITAQPSNVTVTAGGTASFTVTATNATSYQWSHGNSTINGATSATYSISSAQSSDAGVYFVTVSNSGGSVVSSNALLTVNAVVVTPPTTPSTPSSGGGGGGGGAPSLWFYGMISLLAFARFVRRR